VPWMAPGIPLCALAGPPGAVCGDGPDRGGSWAGPAFAGIAALLALIPLQGLFGRFFVRQRQHTVAFTDSRVKSTGRCCRGSWR